MLCKFEIFYKLHFSHFSDFFLKMVIVASSSIVKSNIIRFNNQVCHRTFVRFEVLTAVAVKSTILGVMPYIPVEIC
jgi:hypothetical protein